MEREEREREEPSIKASRSQRSRSAEMRRTKPSILRLSHTYTHAQSQPPRRLAHDRPTHSRKPIAFRGTPENLTFEATSRALPRATPALCLPGQSLDRSINQRVERYRETVARDQWRSLDRDRYAGSRRDSRTGRTSVLLDRESRTN